MPYLQSYICSFNIAHGATFVNHQSRPEAGKRKSRLCGGFSAVQRGLAGVQSEDFAAALDKEAEALVYSPARGP